MSFGSEVESAENELRQRKLNAARQAAEVSTLEAELRRIKLEFAHEVISRMPKAAGRPTRECFYCLELIPIHARMCPVCKGIFRETAFEFYRAEKLVGTRGGG